MLRSPFPWVGGKSRVREQIIKLFPPHGCYVEVFAGAAWILLGKDPATSRSEVLNDLDGELVNFWRVVKHRSAELTEAASWLLASRQLFNEWKSLSGVSGEVVRAVRFFAVIRMSYSARRASPSFAVKPRRRPALWWPLLKEEVSTLVDRLRKVWIEHLPWEKCVRAYDLTDTLFYLDPPYRVESAKAYRHYFTDEDHARLADCLLGKVKGKWLLSYNDDRFIRQLYRGRRIRIERLVVPYSMARGRSEKDRVSELLIHNF